MAIERYSVGRVGTKRQHSKADFADSETVRTVMEEMAAGGPYTVEERLADAERRATAHLQHAGMPLAPSAPPYGDPGWLRRNERTSLVWYAIKILNTVRFLRQQIERGDARLAADLALDLGVLATEARFVQARTEKQGQGGRAQREEAAQRHVAWRRQAVEIWERHPTWSASEVARLIAKDAGCSFQTVRQKIPDLDPKKS
jgi:hypothetical protein